MRVPFGRDRRRKHRVARCDRPRLGRRAGRRLHRVRHLVSPPKGRLAVDWLRARKIRTSIGHIGHRAVVEPSEADLWERSRAGDPDAFGILIRAACEVDLQLLLPSDRQPRNGSRDAPGRLPGGVAAKGEGTAGRHGAPLALRQVAGVGATLAIASAAAIGAFVSAPTGGAKSPILPIVAVLNPVSRLSAGRRSRSVTLSTALGASCRSAWTRHSSRHQDATATVSCYHNIGSTDSNCNDQCAQRGPSDAVSCYVWVGFPSQGLGISYTRFTSSGSARRLQRCC